MKNQQIRYQLPPAEKLSPQQNELVKQIAEGPRAKQKNVVPLTDADGNLTGVFALMPIATAIGEKVQAVGAALRFENSLSPLSRELGILAVAANQKSDFEWYAHKEAAIQAGATPEQLAALKKGDRKLTGLPTETVAVLKVIYELIDSASLSDESYAAANEALGAQALAETVWLHGYYAMLASALAVFRPPLPPEAYGMFSQ